MLDIVNAIHIIEIALGCLFYQFAWTTLLVLQKYCKKQATVLEEKKDGQ